MTDEPNNPAPTQADHGNAIAFLEAHGGEDWTLDWLVANAMMQTRLAHTPPAQPEAGEAKKLPRGPVEPVKMPPYHYQTPDYGGGSVSATPPAPADPVGPENDAHLFDMLAGANQIVFAWGPSAKLPKRLRSRWEAVSGMVRELGQRAYSICAPAKDGHPCHPLMLPYSSELQRWTLPQERTI